jgi:hypothetical protein
MSDNQNLQLAINSLQDRKADLEAKYKKVNMFYMTAEIVFGVSVAGEIFVVSLYELWGFLFFASLIVWLATFGKRRNLAKQLAEITQELRAKRDQAVTEQGN